MLGELCTGSPLLSMACEACSVCQGPGWDSKIAEVRAAQRCAGGTFAACWSELLFTLVLRGLVEKGIIRHSGKRPPSECTICFTSCMLGPSCGVSPHVFQKGRTTELLVGSQTTLAQYLIFHHQGSISTCKITCILFYCPLCLVESNFRAPPQFLAEKVVVSILMV